MSFIKKILVTVFLAALPGVASVRAAEFEVLDRFSVDGYTVLKGSADIPGGSFTVGGSAFVVNGGNVGIGTTSPGYGLELIKAAGVHLSTTATAGYGLYLNTAGNVGIGTTGPEYKFDVFGTLHASGNTTLSGNMAITKSEPDLTLNSTGGSVYQRLIFSQDGGSGVSMLGYANSILFMYAAGFHVNPTSFFQVNSNGYNPILSVPYVANIVDYLSLAGGISGSNATTISALGADSNINIILSPKGSGNVGIGSTGPGHKLQVEGTSALSLPVVGLGGAMGTVDQQDFVRNTFTFENTTQVPISNTVLSPGAKWRAVFRGTWANNYEGGALNQPGPYIELTSESPALAVGSITITLSRNATTGKLQAITTSGSGSKHIGFSGTIEILSSNLNAGWANSMILQGNVGIGTAGPNANLEVKSFAADQVQLWLKSHDYASGVGEAAAFTTDNGRLQIALTKNGWSGYGDIVLQPAGGNVGIGTTNPATTFDVSGTAAIKIPVGTTDQRPATPANGMLRVNTTNGKLEYYNNTRWNTIGGASGGTITEVGGYRIHTFTSNGMFTPSSDGNVEYLVVAGGGAGGQGSGGGAGGGGAGGFRTGTNYAVSGGVSITVTVGAGGAATIGAGPSGHGGDSVFGTITSIGGGGSGSGNAPATGGSGGGGGEYTNLPGAAGTVNQGNAGGSTSATGVAAGGGGAGGAGGNSSGSVVGAGGIGLSSDISGTATYYAGGGGASGNGLPGSAGGQGGGGHGGPGSGGSGTPTSGAANTGGGGGGTYQTGAGTLTGGSGIVIVRYPL